ncbi:MAG: nicotinate (nicotinamide) nucleotide adenylyltransferase [Erysipelotrichaceae bacterium]|nr:nicotinate (nicotinamide) nucleotide adenylyltransferase [Erysipelotrichaceae bacterium]MDY5251270.1 nicotinate (nicotinamide) nucleotide adenylyltransferase [Erysipelotrichaceae bacterium]
MNIVFIGSFNPVTKAHIMIAKEILKQKDVQKIIFVPVSDHYDKASLQTASWHRQQMLRLACTDRMVVSDIEDRLAKQLGRQPKTYETLCALSQEYPQLTLLIGMDNYWDFPTWYRVDDLLSQFKVMVYPRGHKDEDVTTSPLYPKYHQSFIFIDPIQVSDISATKVRAALQQQADVHALLDEKVINYILEHKEELNYE